MKTLLLTGAAGGFGKSIARLFVSKGYYVGLYDLNEAGLETLAAELGDDNCCYRSLDVADPEDCMTAVEHFAGHTNGQLDILLNNAGITAVGSFEEVELERSLKIVDVNLKGVMSLTYHAFPHLRDTPGAQVLNMASASTLHGNPELVSYSLTKRALNSFTESLDIGWERYGIRVADINPMYARTAMVTDYQHKHRALPDDQVKLTAEDVAKAVWDTAHNKTVHNYVGTDTKIFSVVQRFVPFGLKRAITKRVIGF